MNEKIQDDKVYKDKSLGIKRRPHDRADYPLPYDLSCAPSMMPQKEVVESDTSSTIIQDNTPTFEDDGEEEL